MRTKKASIIILVAVVTILHYATAGGYPALHLLHREMYFIPILLAGFWFGLRIALITSLGISLLFLPPVLAGKMVLETPTTVVAQLIIFNLVALMVGLLRDRQAKEQERVLTAEKMALLGQAASAIALEVKDVVDAMRDLLRKGESGVTAETLSNTLGEIDRLDHLLYALMRFVPAHQMSPISLEVMDLVAASAARMSEMAQKRNVKVLVDAQTNGCRSRAVTEDFGRMLDAVVRNAVEASPAGAVVTLGVRREDGICVITVGDHGQGIPLEHLDKIFLPFFSTKPGGHGLTLASTKKYLKDIGGDMTVESEQGRGTVFHLHIPRERAHEEPLERFGA